MYDARAQPSRGASKLENDGPPLYRIIRSDENNGWCAMPACAVTSQRCDPWEICANICLCIPDAAQSCAAHANRSTP